MGSRNDNEHWEFHNDGAGHIQQTAFRSHRLLRFTELL
jgi:hypothetical protein